MAFLWLILFLAACQQNEDPPPIEPEPWSDKAEVLFQQEAVLRYTLEQQKLEQAQKQ